MWARTRARARLLGGELEVERAKGAGRGRTWGRGQGGKGGRTFYRLKRTTERRAVYGRRPNSGDQVFSRH